MDTASSSFPSADKLRIGFIGAGRLGKALAWSLAGAGLRVSAVASVTPANARALAGPIPGCVAADAQAVVDSCDLVFVTTPDGAVTTTTEACERRLTCRRRCGCCRLMICRLCGGRWGTEGSMKADVKPA